MTGETRFVDTGYWLALVNAGDRLHAQARQLAASPAGKYLTTEAILLELGNALSSQRWRHLAVPLLDRIRADSRIEVVPLSSELLAHAIALYRDRADKEWGLTDCVSFVVMEQRGIREALAADQHFAQAGFVALMNPEKA